MSNTHFSSGESTVKTADVSVVKALQWGLFTGFVALQLWGLYWPESQWATHYWAFLPVSYSVTVVMVAIVVLMMPLQCVELIAKPLSLNHWWIGGAYVLLGSVGFGQSFIATDMYGDGFTLLRQLASGQLEKTQPLLFSAKNGIDYSLRLVQWIVQTWHVSARQGFQILSVCCGGVWLAVVYGFVIQQVSNWYLRIALLIGLGSAGFTGIFRGDIEVYAVPMLLHTLVFVCAVYCIEMRTWRSKALLLLLYLLDFSFHSTAILFLPMVVQSLLMGKSLWSTDLTRKYWWFGVLIPGTGVFAWLYFFKLQSYRLPYVNLGAYDVFKTLFLPIVPDKPPFDRYTVWSPAHILDYLNAFWHNGLYFFGLMVFLVVFHLWKGSRFVPKNALTLACFYTLVIVSGFYFFANCTLGMARDWDMLGLPVLMTSLTLVVFCGQIEWDQIWIRYWLKASWVVFLCTLPQLVVNQNSRWVNYRLMALSMQTWQGYHAGSAYLLNVAIKNLKMTPSVEYATRKGLMDRMQAKRWSRLDIGIAENAVRLGQLCHELKNDKQGVYWYELADEAFPQKFMVRKGLCAQYFFAGEYAKAYQLSVNLLEANPEDILLLDIAMLASNRLNEPGLASAFAAQILRLQPNHSQALRFK